VLILAVRTKSCETRTLTPGSQAHAQYRDDSEQRIMHLIFCVYFML
jgi:hypothetical protein